MGFKASTFKEALDKLKSYIEDPWLRDGLEADLTGFSQRENFDLSSFCTYLTSSLDAKYELNVARFIADAYDLELTTDSEKIFSEISWEDLEKYTVTRARNDLCIPLTGGRVVVTTPSSRGVGNRIPIITTRSIVLDILGRIDISRSKSSIEVGYDLKLIQRVEDVFISIVQQAIVRRVSDIHIEYNEFLKASVVRFRQDGVLVTYAIVSDPDIQWHLRLANHIMVRSNLNAGEFFRLHDAQIEVEIAKRIISVRVSIVPMYVMGKIPVPQFCMRIMATEDIGVTSELVDLGFSIETAQKLRRLVHAPNGMILVCGPTGSGKNTTLYALLNIIIKSLAVKIISIEDPVEKKLKSDSRTPAGIVQIEVNPAVKITFADALRSVLRHDPDVVFVGEIRDIETAEEAVKAGITGHLVFSTLHTNSSFDVIPRLTQTLKVHPNLVESVLRSVLSQRLVRKLCPNCARFIYFGELADFLASNEEGEFRNKVTYDLNYLKSTYLSPKFADLIRSDDVIGIPIGCPKCGGYGFKGRTVLWDLLVFTPANRERLFREGKGEIYLYLDPQCESMASVALDLVKKKITSLDEVERFVDIISFYEMFRRISGGDVLTSVASNNLQTNTAVVESADFINRILRCEDALSGLSGRINQEVKKALEGVKTDLGKSIDEKVRDVKTELRNYVDEKVKQSISSITPSDSLPSQFPPNAVLEDINSRIEKLEENFSSRVADLRNYIDEKVKQSISLITSSDSLSSQSLPDAVLLVEDVNSRIEKLEESFSSRVDKVDGEVRRFAERLNALESSMLENFRGEVEDIKQRIRDLDAGLLTRFNGVESDIADLKGVADGLNRIGADIEELAERISALESLALDKKLQNLSDDFKSELEGVKQKIGDLDAELPIRFRDIESSIAGFKKALDELNKDSGAMEQIDRLVEVVESLDLRISDVERIGTQIESTLMTDLQALAGIMEELTTRVDSLEKEISRRPSLRTAEVLERLRLGGAGRAPSRFQSRDSASETVDEGDDIEVPVPPYPDPQDIYEVFQVGQSILGWECPWKSPEDIPQRKGYTTAVKLVKQFLAKRGELEEMIMKFRKTFMRTSAGTAPICMASESEQLKLRTLVKEVFTLKFQIEWIYNHAK
ncbi:MAG: ATPase, T2SS/T4P/T4SS family [Thermoproteota archaeon]